MADDNTTALMLRLFKRLKVEMNGAVVGGMEDRGLQYSLNYGVSLPTICQVASQYKPNNSLAMLLVQQQVRELQLAAAYVAEPDELTLDQVSRWTEFLATDELIDVASQTFAQVKNIECVAINWLENNMNGYLALQVLSQFYKQGRGEKNYVSRFFINQLYPVVDGFLDRCFIESSSTQSERLSRNIQNATVNLLREVARRSTSDRNFIVQQIKQMESSESEAKRNVAQELGWQLDYC